MASETVMYMSLLLIGMLAFGFFSYSMTNFSNQATEITSETNITEILSSLANKIVELISQARELRGSNSAGTNTTLQLRLEVPESFNARPYTVNFTKDSEGIVSLLGLTNIERPITSTISLGIRNSTVAFIGSFFSDSTYTPLLKYKYNVNLGIEQVILSNSI